MHSFPHIIFFFFNDTATTEIYTLSLHDALPISGLRAERGVLREQAAVVVLLVVDPEVAVPQETARVVARFEGVAGVRSEEHTSELQSRQYLVCRLLLEKKKKQSKLTIQCMKISL